MSEHAPLALYNEDRSNVAFAALDWYEQRTLIEAAVHRLPMDAILVDHRTGPTSKTFCLVRRVGYGPGPGSAYVTYLVCHRSGTHARWISDAICLENGDYGHCQSSGFLNLVNRAS